MRGQVSDGEPLARPALPQPPDLLNALGLVRVPPRSLFRLPLQTGTDESPIRVLVVG
jgi:hypothetical protein